MSTKKIAVVGLGLIGKERLRAIAQLRTAGRDIAVTAVLDPGSPKAEDLARDARARAVGSIDELLADRPELVVVATPNDVAVDVTSTCLGRGVDVLIEKPLGRSATEAQALVDRAREGKASLWVGFNYRFQPGIRQLVLDAKSGLFGEIVSVKAVLGHGGEPNMGKTWKLDKEKIGGGCLLDPGIHLLDLFHVLSKGPPAVRGAMAWRGFWKKELDEECHVVLDGGGFPMNLDVSLVRWRSTFGLEVHGTDGYGIVTGRNRSYGPQRYVRGERWGWRGGTGQRDSETLVLETDGDESFVAEMDALLYPDPASPLGPSTGAEALEVMQLLERCTGALS